MFDTIPRTSPKGEATANKRMKLTGAAILFSRGMKVCRRPRQLILIVRRQNMARITIEDFDAMRHGNPMWYIDDAQRERHQRAPTIVPYKVCVVNVCGFAFVFHSLSQLRLCLEYYSLEHQPSSRLPVYDKNLGGDHWETQRWFEKLPQYLLEKPKRLKVVVALKKALEAYSEVPEAETGTAKKPLHEW
jgi:hypothetical protein